MATYAELQKRLTDARTTEKAARDQRDVEEFESKVLPILAANLDYGVVRCPGAAAELPGHVVVRMPTKHEIARFRSTMWENAEKRGVKEAKAKAGGELVESCLVYPAAEDYARLIEKHNAIVDKVAEEALRLSAAGAAAEEKD